MNFNNRTGFFLGHCSEVFITAMNIDDLFDSLKYEPLFSRGMGAPLQLDTEANWATNWILACFGSS
jgi:hypothetical protein